MGMWVFPSAEEKNTLGRWWHRAAAEKGDERESMLCGDSSEGKVSPGYRQTAHLPMEH